jgi:hypothetical protein
MTPPPAEDRRTALRLKALADRDARPWNYYKLEHADMKRMLNEQADRIAFLLADRGVSAPQEKP